MSKQPAVYMMANHKAGTIYIGVTSGLAARCWEHKNDAREGFTKQHGLHRLVFFEPHTDMKSAIAREKQLKKWNRAWKVKLIEQDNPDWRDLWEDVV